MSAAKCLAKATDDLIRAARQFDFDSAKLSAVGEDFIDAIAGASEGDADQAIGQIANHFETKGGAYLLALCSEFLEAGASPLLIEAQFVGYLQRLLEGSARLLSSCVAANSRLDMKSAQQAEQLQGCITAARAQMPEEFSCWQTLKLIWQPAIELLAISSELRSAARHLRGPAFTLMNFHDAGRWLYLILGVLEQERLLIIEPEFLQGIWVRVSGIVDNYQLHGLLMDVFPSSTGTRRISKRAAKVLRGEGSQETKEKIQGVWDLYSWESIRADLRLPNVNDVADEQLILNEDTLEDFPLFEGCRVVLLGPPAYEKKWNCHRVFDGLKASIEIERVLERDETSVWLRRMASSRLPRVIGD